MTQPWTGWRVKRIGLAGALVFLSMSAPQGMIACTEGRVEIRGSWGIASFQVEIADTPALQQRGLQHRDHLPLTHGMFFLFAEPGPASFWMKDTRIPLDMIFIDAMGQVLHVHHRAAPHDQTPITHDGSVRAVLEINGGLAEIYGITSDSVIRHPRLNQGIALWSCND